MNRKIVVCILGLISFSHLIYAQQGASRVKLPDFEPFIHLPTEVQVIVFEKYLDNATTVPELYDLVSVWKRAHENIFKDLAESSIGVKTILKVEADIIRFIQQNLIDEKLGLYATFLDPYVNIIDAIRNKKAIVTETTKQAYQRNKTMLRPILSRILAGTAYYSETLSLIKQLIANGADVNFHIPDAEVRGDNYKGETPLCRAVKGMINRMDQIYGGKATLPNFEDELNKLRLLVSKGADPAIQCQGTTLIQLLKDRLQTYKNIAPNAQFLPPFKNYVDGAVKILSSKKSFFGTGKKK